jgi:hypothetical protein
MRYNGATAGSTPPPRPRSTSLDLGNFASTIAPAALRPALRNFKLDLSSSSSSPPLDTTRSERLIGHCHCRSLTISLRKLGKRKRDPSAPVTVPPPRKSARSGSSPGIARAGTGMHYPWRAFIDTLGELIAASIAIADIDSRGPRSARAALAGGGPRAGAIAWARNVFSG